MKRPVTWIIVVVLAVIFSVSDACATDASGTISDNTTWTLAGSPYIVTGDITIAAGVTLTIQPGVVVKLNQYRGVWVEGMLSAVGTSSNPITFTGTTETPDWWRFINIESAGSADLEWCHIAYGGYNENAGVLKTGAGSLTLENSTISYMNMDGDGLRIAAGYSSFTSAGNTFSNNNIGVRLGINTSFDDNTSNFQSNNVNLYVDGGAITQNVTLNLKKDYSCYISGDITVNAGATLTVKPGTVVKVGHYFGLWVNGTLNAPGTSAAPIYFTDWRDDVVGGDANGDGNATAPASYWWRAIFIQGEGPATMAWCTLRYAGYNERIGLYKTGSGGLSMSNCTVSDISGYGMVVESSTGNVSLSQSTIRNNLWSGLYMKSGPTTATNSTFSNNGQYGILQEANDSLVYTGNTFTGNTLGGVGVNTGTITRNITWQAAGSPFCVTGDITVAAGATLTITPGTLVKFNQYRGVWVDGTLSAVGNSSNPITFTGTTEAPGWWRCINIENAGSADLEWCHIAYGGYFENAGVLKTGTGSLILQNSAISNISGDGLRIAAGYSAFTSSGNTFSNNNIGVRLGINTSFDDNTSNFQSNNVNLYVDGGTITQNITLNLKKDYACYISGSIYINAGATLTVKTGTVVKFGQYFGLYVNGTLDAVGTSSAPIYFTDWRDDVVGGDANGDGNATAPASYWWRAVFIQEEGSATMAWCTLRYAGYNERVGLYKTGSGDLNMTSCTVSDMNGNGMVVQNSTGEVSLSQFTFENNAWSGLYMNSGPTTATNSTFSNNGQYGILQEVNDSLVYTGNTFTGNTLGGVGVKAGTITSNITWRAAGSPYIVTGDITVAVGVTLTIEPGTVVKFNQFCGLWVEGTLSALGISTEPITFTGTTEAPGWWRCINIENAGSADLEWCHIAYGGYFENAGVLKTGTGSLILQNSAISNISGDGLRIAAGYSAFTSEGNTFFNNNYGVRLGINTSFDDNTSDFHDNNVDVYVDGGAIAQDVTLNLKKDYSCYLSGDITINAGVTLTVKPGTVVKFGHYCGLLVNGTLNAVGTSAAPIYFTDWRDDVVGGDANGDGNATAPASGWWRVIFIQGEGSATMEWCTIRYAGYYEQAGLYKTGSGSLALKNSTISNINNGDGLRAENSTGDHEISRSLFTDNNIGILVRNQSTALAISGSRFETNASYGVLNQNSAQVDARSNWWGDATGPYHATLNPQGLGDHVSDGVLFNPWRMTSSVYEILAPMRSGTLVQGDSLRFMGSAFNDPSIGYSWDFGNGRSSSERNPGVVNFPVSGTYEVKFTSITNGQADLNPDTRVFTVVQDTGPYPDLLVTQLTIPDSLAVGQTATFAYSVQNVGDGAINSASWVDALYFSEDLYLDAKDTLLGSVVVDLDVSPGASYQNTINVTLPAAAEGAHYLILSVNDEWQVLEQHRLNNEHSASVNLLIPSLTSGVEFTGNYNAGRVEHYYKMTTAEAQNLLLNFADNQTGLQIYVRYGALPTRGTYDFLLTDGSLAIPAPTAGEWFILIYGMMDQAGQYAIEYSSANVVISSVSPTHCSTLEDLEMTINGAGFTNPVAVELVAAGGAVYGADSEEVDSFTQVTGTFSAGAVPAGTYMVRVSHGGSVGELASGLTVVAGGKAELETRLILPARFGYHQLATVYVEYENSGDAPMPAPLLLVTASQEGRQAAIMTLDQSRLSQGFWTSAMPEGFANSVQLLASGEKPGVLQPGETRRVPVYYAGWQQPWDFSYPPIDWQVGVLDAENNTPVNWDGLKTELRPFYIREDAWEIVWDNFIAQAGATWGTYVGMLSRNANYLDRLGQRVEGLEPLLALSFRKADGLSPMPALAATTDVVVEASGMPIVFDRVNAQPISRRFELGPLGRGWTHNWQYTLTKWNDGTVMITDRTGTPRIFQPDTRYANRYLSPPGDQAALISNVNGLILTEAGGMVYAFANDGKLNYVEDTNDNRIICTYSGDRLTGLTHSSGPSLTIDYNGSGFISKITDYLGRETLFTYSGEYLATCQAYDGRIMSYAMNSTPGSPGFHALTEVDLPDGTRQFFSYDGQGLLAATYRDNNAERINYSYGDGGRVDATDALNHTSRYFFDYIGRLVKGENALGEIDQRIFDEQGNLTAVIDPDGIRSTFRYDRRSNLIEAIDKLHQTTQLTYTRTLNRLASVTDANGQRSGYNYDTQGNLASATYADGSGESWAYDPQGNPTDWTNRRGNPIHFTYDAQGRITGKTYADVSKNVSYTYDPRGNLKTAVDEHGAMTFSYNEKDYLTRIDYPGGRRLEFGYDGAGRRISCTDQLGYTVNYHYDDAGRINRLSDATKDIVTYAYDSLGRLQRKTVGNGVYSIYGYDAAGRLVSLVNYKPDGGVLSSFGYAYDHRGRRTSMTTRYGVWTYSYDDLGQLCRAVLESTDAGIQDQDLSYEYDAMGNRVRVVENGQTESYDVNNMNQYAKAGDRTYTYDADGNLIQETGPDGTILYSYNDENRLIGITKGGNAFEYAYDALGKRISVDENGTTTHYVIDPSGLGDIISEYNDSGNLLARNTYGLGLVSRTVGGGTENFFTFDPMGNASELTGPAGVINNTYAYQPFGKMMQQQQAVVNPFKFSGESGVMADDGDLYYMRARHYDAETGRFTAIDPINIGGGDVNLYRYAMNTPGSMADPLGLYCGPKGRPVGKQQYAESWTRYHDHLDMRGVKRHPSGNIDENDYINQYFHNRSNLHHDTQGLAVDIVNDKVKDSFWSWIPFYDWFSGTSDVKDVMDGVNDARNPGKTCRWNERGPTPTPPAGAGTRGAGGSGGSQDPNEKQTVAGYGALNYVADGSLTTYRIDFENMSTATAPAQFVTIRDALSPNLDLSTFELLEVGFGEVLISIPSGQQYIEKTVDYSYSDDDYNMSIEVLVEAGIDENGQIFANFTSIDPETGMPPQNVGIGFLMPENDTGRGQGHISFAIRPKAGLTTGTAVRNIATIQFDLGLKIDTNQINPLDPNEGTDPDKEALVTFDTADPTSAVSSLPAEVHPAFSVSWAGQDADTGIACYDVYVQENNGAWTLWQNNTSETSGEFTGDVGKLYGFYSVAMDNAGNREDKPVQAEAQTLVTACEKGDVNGDGEITLADAILAAQIAAGVDTGIEFICLSADVNNDQKIGIVEMIYVLERVSGLRGQ